jgi:hypothetical protein
MSKKLIAVASAAALALTALVGIAPSAATSAPAIAITPNVAGASAGTSSSSPATVDVLRDNVVTTATSKAVAVDISNLVAGDVYTVKATGGVRILTTELTATADFDASKAGFTDFTDTFAAGDDVAWFAFTTSTSTTPGSIVLTYNRTGSSAVSGSQTVYLQGLSANAVKYNLTEVTNMPTTLAKGAKQKFQFKVTDINGNVLENAMSTHTAVTVTGSAAAAVTWNSVTKLHEFEITSPSSDVFLVSIDLGASGIAGRVAEKDTAAFVVNSPAVASANASLTSQVAALVTAYNALAAKWNKKVASKTAPKKKVALK